MNDDTKGDIILNGVSLKELAESKKKIQKAAVKFISDNMEKGLAIVQEIADMYNADDENDEGNVVVDEDTIAAKAEEAMNLLANVSLVSGISGVPYSMPWDREYGYQTTYSRKFETILDDSEYTIEFNSKLDNLLDYIGDMEYEVKGWEQSTC